MEGSYEYVGLRIADSQPVIAFQFWSFALGELRTLHCKKNTNMVRNVTEGFGLGRIIWFIKENGMGGTCSTNGKDEKCVQNISQKF